MRRKTDEPPLSLFAFQDIITSVTGVLILLSLILSLSLFRSTPAATESADSPLPDVSEQELAALREQVRQLDESTAHAARVRQQVAGHSVESLERELAQELEQLAELRNAQAALDREAPPEIPSGHPELQRELRALHAAGEKLRQELAEQNRQRELLLSGSAVVYNPDPNAPKRPWFVDISATRITVLAAEGSTPAEFAGTSPKLDELEFRAWAAAHDSDSEYFVLLVRPDGIDRFPPLHSFLRARRFDTGIDLLAQDAKLMTESP